MNHTNHRCSTEPIFPAPEPRKGFVDAGIWRPRREVFHLTVDEIARADFDNPGIAEALEQRLRILPNVETWRHGSYGGSGGFDHYSIVVTNDPPSITRVGAPRAPEPGTYPPKRGVGIAFSAEDEWEGYNETAPPGADEYPESADQNRRLIEEQKRFARRLIAGRADPTAPVSFPRAASGPIFGIGPLA